MQGSTINTVIRLMTNPLIVGLVVMLCMGLLAYRVFGLIAAGDPEPIVAFVSKKSEIQKHNKNQLNVSQLVALNLFGKANKGANLEETLEQEDIPETRLKLVLKGAFTSTEEEASSALIAAGKRSKAERYFVGDEVPGNALLHEVAQHGVVLKRGGKLEKLLFPRELGQSEAGSASKGLSSVPKRRARPVISNNPKNLNKRLEQLQEQLDQNENNIRI